MTLQVRYTEIWANEKFIAEPTEEMTQHLAKLKNEKYKISPNKPVEAKYAFYIKQIPDFLTFVVLLILKAVNDIQISTLHYILLEHVKK